MEAGRHVMKMAPLRGRYHRIQRLSHAGTTSMATRRFSFRGATTDIACVLLLGLASLLLYLHDSPFRRGFFCDDESIRYPVPTHQTVSDVVVGVVGVCAPMIVIVLTETVQAGLAQPTSLVLFGWTPRVWMVQCYAHLGVFLFGGGVQLVTVEAAKRMIGRLRPHFYTACLPVGLDCSKEGHKYIADYTCSGDNDIIKEARLSFPSGHSALSFYAATFLIMYLQTRMTWECSKLLKHMLQVIAVLTAWVTSLSRVSDYMHHWSDVLAGMAVGIITGILTILFVSTLHRKKLSTDAMELMALMRKPTSAYTSTENNSRMQNELC